LGMIGSPMGAGKAHLIAFLAGIIAVHSRGFTHQYAKNNTPLPVKIYQKSNNHNNGPAGTCIRLGKISIFLLPSLAVTPH
jgi:hypothetical protein